MSMATYGLRDFMSICAATGAWMPGSIDGNPVFTAAYLEHVRRGGPPSTEPTYELWLARNATPEWLSRVIETARTLQEMTERGADSDEFGAYLDQRMDEEREI